MRVFYFVLSLPVILISVLLVSLCPRVRYGFKSVQGTISKNPRTEFNNLLTHLLILAEDHRYESHFGFDPIAIVRAACRIIVSNKLEGASTIEQQFVRTITKKYEISLLRKSEEIAIAVLISLNNSKIDIAYSYLSTAYYGFNIVGYKSASKVFLSDKTSKDSDLFHGASIVALLKRPKPSQPNNLWIKRHETRVFYIVNRHNALINPLHTERAYGAAVI